MQSWFMHRDTNFLFRRIESYWHFIDLFESIECEFNRKWCFMRISIARWTRFILNFSLFVYFSYESWAYGSSGMCMLNVGAGITNEYLILHYSCSCTRTLNSEHWRWKKMLLSEDIQQVNFIHHFAIQSCKSYKMWNAERERETWNMSDPFDSQSACSVNC